MTPRKRLVFVDAVRLLAVLQMINGHTLDALLRPELRHGPAFDAYNFGRGLVSVAFLVVAGMAFHITRLSRPDSDGTIAPGPSWPRVRRALQLLLVGYLMRFPIYAVLGGERARAAFDLLFAVDVLAAVAVALLVLEALTRLLRRRSRIVAVSALVAAGIFAVAPLADSVTPTGWSRPLLDYLSHRGGSSFPVFPWSGYVFTGVVVAQLACPRAGDSGRARLTATMALLALASWAGATAVSHSPWSLWHPGLTYATLPSFALVKLAAVLALLGASALVTAGLPRLPGVLAALSEETLFLYVFHYAVLFWPPFTVEGHIGRTLGLGAGLCVSASMMALCTVAALSRRAARERGLTVRSILPPFVAAPGPSPQAE